MKNIFLKGMLCSLILQSLPILADTTPDAWSISVSNPLVTPYYGATLANGMLGLTSSSHPLRNSNVVLGGTYDKFGRGDVSNFIDNIRFMDMSMSIDGEEVNRQTISEYSQRLDMHGASIVNKFSVHHCTIETRQYALRQLPHSALTEVTVMPQADVTLAVANTPAVPQSLTVTRCHYRHLKRKRGTAWLLSIEALSPTGKHRIASSASFMTDNGDIQVDADTMKHMASFTVKLKKGSVYRFALTGSLITSAQVADPGNEAERLTIFASFKDIDSLVRTHEQEWDRLWESDITVDGDLQAQQDIHYMLYSLYSFVREGSRLSVSPMGLSGLGYNGHIFWDADMWIMPPLLLLHPELARSMIDYRIDRLEAARRNAFCHGYKGAMFPWESSDTGNEETPVWAVMGPLEHHISGCVALEAWNYFLVTRDTLWLSREAYPLLRDVADFWVSRIDTDAHGRAHIRGVVCADEYAANVDDNAFTNAIAMRCVDIARQAAVVLGERQHAGWTEMASALPILKMENGVTQEYEGYNGERIKQADVNLLAYPLGTIIDSAQMALDLEYYEKKVARENTPAMTEAIFSILYARLGNVEQATRCLYQSYRPNQCQPFGALAECKGGTNPYFATGAGGTLQAVIMGFGGYEITDMGINKRPTVLPAGWKGLTIKTATYRRRAACG